jgi:hypothetical protein
MINTLLADPNPSPVKEGRSALSQALTCVLPEDFLAWVERYGGSSLQDQIAMPDEDGNAVLAYFYDAEEIASIYVSRKGFPRNIPRAFTAVAYGPGGGVCIKITDDDFGSVWFADYDRANEILGADESQYVDDSELPEIMSRIANNWSAFISSR